jgi:hypothetical protein
LFRDLFIREGWFSIYMLQDKVFHHKFFQKKKLFLGHFWLDFPPFVQDSSLIMFMTGPFLNTSSHRWPVFHHELLSVQLKVPLALVCVDKYLIMFMFCCFRPLQQHKALGWLQLQVTVDC